MTVPPDNIVYGSSEPLTSDKQIIDWLRQERGNLMDRLALTENALRLLWAEVVASGNSEAQDYGWPKACGATREALSMLSPAQRATPCAPDASTPAQRPPE